MRKMRGFSKTVAVVLCMALLFSGIVLPRGVVASDVTTGVDKVYPDNLLTESVFSEHFTADSGECSFSVSDDDEYLMEISKGAVIPSKRAIEGDRYTISFDALLPENGSDVGIRFKANAAGTSDYRGVRILSYGNYVGVLSKTPASQASLGQSADPLPTAGDWMHVELAVTETDMTITLTSGTTGKSYTCAAWTYNTTGDALGNYVAFYQEGSAATIKNFQIVEAYDVTATETPAKDGYVFSGYYTDAALSEQYTETTGTAYRKFVDANVLSVKAQKSDGTDGAKDVRFVTSVDCLNYGKVGFEITVGNKTITKETTKVYAQLQAGTQQVDPSVFSSQSQYMAAYSLWEIPESAFDTEIKVRAYWETSEGLIVYGAYRTVTVNGLA